MIPAVVLASVVAPWLFGWAVQSRLDLGDEDAPGRHLFSFAIGLGAVGCVNFLLGLAGLFHPYYGLAFALVAGLLAGSPALIGQRARRVARSTTTRRPDPVCILLALLAAAFAALTLTGARAPATSNEWDSLAYHLAVPRVWLAAGRIHPVPYDHHANFPMLVEMLFSIGLASGSVAVAKAFHWFYGMLGAAACVWAGRRWVSARAGWLAAVLYLAVPVVGWEAGTAYIDLAATLYVALSVFAFIRWLENRRSGWLALAGVMAGFACGTKMTMLASSGLLVLWCVGLAALRKDGVRWRDAATLAALTIGLGAFWYIRTWLWMGNPVYPFAYGVLGGRHWSAAAARDYAREQARFGIGKTLNGFWTAPWATAFHAEYYANPPAVYQGELTPVPEENATPEQLEAYVRDFQRRVFPAVYGSLGIGVLALLPLWFLRRSVAEGPEDDDRNQAMRRMVLYSGGFAVVWFGLTHQSRYLVPIVPLLLMPAVAGARVYWRAGGGWRMAAGGASAVAIGFGLLPLWTLARPALAVAWGGETQETFLQRNEPVYGVSEAINRDLPKDAKLLFLQEVRGFYIDRAYQWGNPSQNALIPWDRLASPEAMDQTLKQRGITHVLVNWGAVTPDTDQEFWPRLVRAAISQGRWTQVIPGPDAPETGMAVYRIGGT